MKILTVVGARPNFMKAAPLITAIKGHNERLSAPRVVADAVAAEPIHHILVHTGQHYDEIMSGTFFTDLELPQPAVYLGAGSGSHAMQTADIMTKFERVVVEEKPDVLIVVGDVNSTVACALVASKIPSDVTQLRPLIVHVEAGLRSFDRSMPEEINRIVTDHLSDLLFVTEESGLNNLRNEGIPPEAVHFVGNTMIDSLLAFKDRAEASTILERLGLSRRARRSDGSRESIEPYALLTLHRPQNVDNRVAFLNILEGLDELAAAYPIVFPIHPRTRRRITEFSLDLCTKPDDQREHPVSSEMPRGLKLVDPLGYLDFLCLMKHAIIVVTDSGGIQEETTCLRIPCVTVRDNTERPVTVRNGTNVIAGTKEEGIRRAVRRQVQDKRGATGCIPDKWDGKAADRIVEILIAVCGNLASCRQVALQ